VKALRALTYARDYLKKFFGIRLANRIIILVALGFGICETSIRERLGSAPKTIRKIRNIVNNGDGEKLWEDNVYRQPNELDNHADKILSEFDKNPPRSLTEAKAKIEEICGIGRSVTRIKAFLKKTGLDPS
jgi:hypothetical protein